MTARAITYTWQEQAKCIGLDISMFYPDDENAAKEAKAICQECVVREECLEYALSIGERFGIWGGFTERQRRRLLFEDARFSEQDGSNPNGKISKVRRGVMPPAFRSPPVRRSSRRAR